MTSKKTIWPFRRLRGKMTLSYMLTSVVTVLLIEILAVGGSIMISLMYVPYFVLNTLKQEVPQATPYFVHGSPDRLALATWLSVVNSNTPNKQGPFTFSPPLAISVVDTQGYTLASAGTHPVTPGTYFQNQLSLTSQSHLRALFHDTKGTMSQVDTEANGTLVGMAAIIGPGGKVEGVLVTQLLPPDKLQVFINFLQFIMLSLVLAIVYAAVCGTISGYVTARGFTRRLKGLTIAADRWSRGDFSAYAEDTSEDELGQTTRQLNSMADQLRNLLQARQKLATLEERNRLARDLHDSVKQQIFAVSMQIGATRYLLRRDTDAAETRLLETEKLVRQAQQELTSLIRELRPVALEGKELTTALRDLATQWTQQTSIVANIRIEDMQTLPLTVEEALFRVAQEALSNAARHSQATLVQITLTTAEETVTLSVEDNGQGFNPASPSHLGVGLLSMRERMQALGGDVEVASSPGKGTRISAHCKRLGTHPVELAMPQNMEEVMPGNGTMNA